MNDQTILYDVDDHVATITLNRPEKMNAWNGTMAEELSDALQAANTDDNVRAVVLTGSGRAFCAGADLDGGGQTFAASFGVPRVSCVTFQRSSLATGLRTTIYESFHTMCTQPR